MAVIGPGAQVQETQDIRPTLEGANEFEYVEILNPLSDDFQIMVAQDIPANLPYAASTTEGRPVTERELVTTYGADLRNKDFKGRKRIYNTAVIRAGGTMRLRGNEAQTALKQLVDAIIQNRKMHRMIADPTTRKSIEDEVVLSRGNLNDLMENAPKTYREQTDEALNKFNEAKDDQPFAGLSGDDEPKTNRAPGRPKKDKPSES